MLEILLAVSFLFGIALIVSVVRTSLRFQRLQRALARGERTPELESRTGGGAAHGGAPTQDPTAGRF